MEKTHPKILIIGETFRKNGGGGITLINLFKQFPKENVAIITNDIVNSDPDLCDNYYQIGYDEKQFIWPLNQFQTKFKSGPYIFDRKKKAESNSSGTNESSIIKSTFKKITKKFELDNVLISRPKLSKTLINWISDFKPDTIYCQPTSLFNMQLTYSIHVKLGYEYSIHFMDNNIVSLNKRIINLGLRKEFQKILSNAKSLIAISPAMANGFEKKFNRPFLSFHNPIETEKWKPFVKLNYDYTEVFRVLFTGRLDFPVENSVRSFCSIISRLNQEKETFKLDIYSLDQDTPLSKEVQQFKGVTLFKPVAYEQIPMLLSKYDALLLPLDFSPKSLEYAKYSISTKTSEYMVSGTPIVVFAPQETALSRYAREKKWGYIIDNDDFGFVVNKLTDLANDINIRMNIGQLAVKVALENHDANVIRKEFIKTIVN